LLSLAAAIALGWSAFQFARGIAAFIDGLFLHLPPHEGGIYAYPNAYSLGGGALTWEVHHRVVTLDGVLIGAIEVVVVLLLIALVARRRPPVPS
jgi:hypothetical protein